jgi:uncharacterized protein YjbI with pentapeptide repeats
MRGIKRDLWKAGMVTAGVSLLFVLMAWVTVSAAGAEVRTSGFGSPGTVSVQATPTIDATVTALNKEKLQHENDWWWNYGATILTSLISTLTLAAAGVFTVVRYFNDRRDTREKQEAEAKRLTDDRKAERERRDEEQQRWLKDQESAREKRAEERFQAAVEGLSSQREEAKIGAAVLLRTFLRPGYEQFYQQVFDLSVANLRLLRTSAPSEYQDPPLPLTTLSQALIVVFKEALPLARRQVSGSNLPFVRGIQSLDATGIQLDNAYLRGADLKQVRMPEASLRNANLKGATLSGADLFKAKLCEASLTGADLSNASLIRANLFKTWLRQADLSEADLSEADLTGANFNEANLSRAILNKVNLEEALSLKDTNLRGVKGLTKEKLAACKAKGAIIDEDSTTSSTQPTVAPSPSDPRNDMQASPAPAAQGNTPTSKTDQSSAPFSKPGPQS